MVNHYYTKVFLRGQYRRYNSIVILDRRPLMLSKRIKSLRLERGMNQVQLANVLGVTKQCVSNWENDNIQPSVEMLVKLSRFFSVSTDFLLGEDSRLFLDVTGLPTASVAHIQQIVEDLKAAISTSPTYSLS